MALNGSPLISQETRDRVGELARTLDYSINVAAPNLASNTTAPSPS